MEIRVFDLPPRSASFDSIEKRLHELEQRSRKGDELDEVEIDWMDTANTWLVMEGCHTVDHKFK